MAIAFDNSADGLASGGSFTAASSTIGGTLVFVTYTDNAGAANGTATFGGQSMTALTSSPVQVATSHYFYVFYLANAPTGSQTVSNNLSHGMQVTSYKNCHATTPIDTSSFSSSNSQTVNPSANTDWLWGFTNSYDVAADFDAGVISKRVGPAGGPMQGDSNGTTTTGNKTQTATFNGANTGALALVAITAAASPATTRNLPLMGVGK